MKNAELLETKMTGSKKKIPENPEAVVSDTVPIQLSLEELNLITEQMRRKALVIFAFTLFNIFFPVFIFSNVIYYWTYSAFREDKLSELLVNTSKVIWIIILFATLTTIYLYESSRRKGDVLFEEISDELEWNVKNHKAEQIANERPEINARITLRSFAKTTDLPFVPGRFGPAFYFVFNVLISLFIGSRFFFRF